jgi:hypothetical protein
MTNNGIKSFSQSPLDGRCLEVWFDKDVTDANRAWLLEAINEKTLREQKVEIILTGPLWQVTRADIVISEHALYREAARAARAARKNT